jgi:hypothetical protein
MNQEAELTSSISLKLIPYDLSRRLLPSSSLNC